MRVLDAAVFKFDGLEERSTQPLNHRASHLVAQAIRIDDGAAFERFDQSRDAHDARSLFHRYFREGRYVTALLKTAGDSESLSLLRFLARPAEGFRRSFQHSAHAGIGEIFHPEI